MGLLLILHDQYRGKVTFLCDLCSLGIKSVPKLCDDLRDNAFKRELRSLCVEVLDYLFLHLPFNKVFEFVRVSQMVLHFLHSLSEKP
jgi:hypothetical protein